MKTESKERRAINIDKDDFDIIKLFCDKNCFDMPKWLTNIAKEKIDVHISKYDKIYECNNGIELDKLFGSLIQSFHLAMIHLTIKTGKIGLEKIKSLSTSKFEETNEITNTIVDPDTRPITYADRVGYLNWYGKKAEIYLAQNNYDENIEFYPSFGKPIIIMINENTYKNTIDVKTLYCKSRVSPEIFLNNVFNKK